jgi:heme-degrading monooxygenase HmoA
MPQTTTFTIFKVKGWRDKFFALKSMSSFASKCKNLDALEFIKLMGCGSRDGFNLMPSFSQYALLCVWKSEEDADAFFKTSQLFKDYLNHTSAFQTIYMKATMSHGLWGGKNPFQIDNTLHDSKQKVAVLTRATIRWKDMIRFWLDVPSVSRSLKEGQLPIFAAGVGELPLRYQATFSIWEESEAMKTFAYKNKAHVEMVKKTRKVGWYSEEMFTRFYPYKSMGDEIFKF